MSSLRDDFLRYVCQTSDSPLGIIVSRARGSTIWDADGRDYLDLLAGIGVAHVGHAHPEVVRAVQQQAERYLHVMVYGEMVQQPQVELARRLDEIAPGDLSVTYFTNSGAEAVEGALKTARKQTGRTRFVAFEGSFHGDTFGALSVGGNPLYRRPFEPLLPSVELLPFGDESALIRIDESVAGVIVELVQGEAGVRVPSSSFVEALRRRCSAVGALLIVDEVITGFGRLGRMFACDHFGIVPDLLVLAKSLGGGLPLGAFVGRPEVMRTLSSDPPLAHVTTFGGHPLCCAAGLAALDVVQRDDLPGRAEALGAELRRRLEALRGPSLREVRGLGALIGLELATPEAAQKLVQGCLERRVIVGWTLHRDTVVRLAPPLVLSDAELERGVAAIRASL